MKKIFGYLSAIAFFSIICLSSFAQDYYQAVAFKTGNEFSGKITVFPNPTTANSYFDIEIDSSYNLHTATLVIYNQSGVIKEDKVLKVQEGNNKFEINIAGYDQGNYVVRVVTNNPKPFSYSTQLVVR
jgi:hypothetical protein